MIKTSADIRTFPVHRMASIDTFAVGKRKHHIPVMLEIDVTRALEKIQSIRKKTRKKLSFTAWFVKCVAEAVGKYPDIHAYYLKRNRSMVFRDVDITVLVERDVGGEKVPYPCVIRGAHDKGVDAITGEIEAARVRELSRERPLLEDTVSPLLLRIYYALPGFIRRAYWRAVLKMPSVANRQMGSITVTSVGMFGTVRGWFIPITVIPLAFAVGSIVDTPRVIQGRVMARKVLYLTVLFDHDVIDGAPAARFMADLTALLENAHGLQA
ncbi:MAG TPA: 2-oxo acid dehydrogenase subunit E2 [Spirochaetota bacterium]|nr:2-oxo acid dehydrogenase subunit E2 [Spirochaetota bacterium]HPC40841.1 2-oxo acid dehydrogenase subunit E2 [Spirochaetota bacterium]HPL17454.1 2-oxo acid dehydrogenase subunit E2 [Spirochaetota bacterium]HQF07769.1 2-oxo acid dehydrogenase subunit E2 [Spirochaetota bacterium]HQH96822.1 2-oxo acid dehydrogenase subunit E2 [Spirochaetota bacterium]